MNMDQLTKEQFYDVWYKQEYPKEDHDLWLGQWLVHFHGPNHELPLSNQIEIDWENDKPRVRSALEYIPADYRPEWLMVGMALHHGTDGSKEGLGVWNEWSATTTKDNYSIREQWRAWRNFGSTGITIASIFYKARANGWKAKRKPIQLGPLSELPTVNLGNVRINGNVLTDAAMSQVKAKFASKEYEHYPSDEQFGGLSDIAQVIEMMAANNITPNFFVSYMPAGSGKTTTLIEAVRAMPSIPNYKDAGVIIFLSRREEIGKLASEMRLKDDDFAVITNEDKYNNLGNPNKTDARVLFTTQQKLNARGTDSFSAMRDFHYKGQPRRVRVWDEAILPSTILTLGQYDISDLLKTISKERKELAAELSDLFTLLSNVKDGEIIEIPDLDGYNIEMEEARAWFENDSDKDAIEALFGMSGRRVRVRDDKLGFTALDYDDILPDDLAPMLILDASANLRKTYEFMHYDRKQVYFLKSPQKSYGGFTIHLWDRGSGRTTHKNDAPTLVKGIAKTINNDIPKSEDVLVVHFKKSKYIPDMPKLIGEQIKLRQSKVHCLNWGQHTATNEFNNVKYVIMSGVLQYRTSQNEFVGRGAKRIKTDDEFSKQDYDYTRLGEIAHNIFQAACRGKVRKSVGDGCPEDCHLYIIMSTNAETGVPEDLLTRTFPGAKVEDWLPVFRLSKGDQIVVDAIIGLAEQGIPAKDKHELRAELGMKHMSQLNRFLGDKHVIGSLAEMGIKIDNQRKQVVITAAEEPSFVGVWGTSLKLLDDTEVTEIREWAPSPLLKV